MHDLCFFLFFFVQRLFLTKNYFHTAEINLTNRGPLYTFYCNPNDFLLKETNKIEKNQKFKILLSTSFS